MTNFKVLSELRPDLNKHLQQHLEVLLQKYPKEQVVGVFLQGSQNYKVDTKFSDVDDKVILLPSLDDLVSLNKAVSTTFVHDNNEHSDLKDVRNFVKELKKQNVNMLELLFTDYGLVNTQYSDLWDQLVSHREELAHYNESQALKTMLGMASNEYHNLEKMQDARKEWVEKFGYDPKKLHHLLRVTELLQRYVKGEPYSELLVSHNPEYLRQVKLGLYKLEDAKQLANETMQKAKDVVNNATDLKPVNQQMDTLLNTFVKDLVFRFLQQQMFNY